LQRDHAMLMGDIVQLCIYVLKTAWAHLYEFFLTTTKKTIILSD